MLGTTFSVAMTLINSVMNFVIGFVFACYILLQKEKLSVQIRKVLYAFLPGKAVRQILKVASLSYRTFSNFVTGQCLEAVILGTMFFVTLSLFHFPYALLIGVLIAGAVSIVGYYLAEVILVGSWTAPLLTIWGNVVQAVGSGILFVVMSFAIDRVSLKKKLESR